MPLNPPELDPELAAAFQHAVELSTDLELVAMQHDLRQMPDDKPYLDMVLKELGKRQGK